MTETNDFTAEAAATAAEEVMTSEDLAALCESRAATYERSEERRVGKECM